MRVDGVGPVSASSIALFPPLSSRMPMICGPKMYGAPNSVSSTAGRSLVRALAASEVELDSRAYALRSAAGCDAR